MDYQQALKQIQASKKEAKPPYLMIRMGYERSYVFPYKEGLSFVAALEHAEQLFEAYSTPSNIGELKNQIEIFPFSNSEYLAYKISNLLQITVQEARDMQSNGAKHD